MPHKKRGVSLWRIKLTANPGHLLLTHSERHGRGWKRLPLAEAQGKHAEVLLPFTETVLRGLRYDPEGLQRGKEYPLTDVEGLRLALMFEVSRPLKDAYQIRNLTREIMAMTFGAVHYWAGQVFLSERREQAKMALRILTGVEEVRYG